MTDVRRLPGSSVIISAKPIRGILTRHRFYGVAMGLPPTLIQVGSDEILRDDAVRMAAKLRQAG
jgi:acetyl esterase/lipase